MDEQEDNNENTSFPEDGTTSLFLVLCLIAFALFSVILAIIFKYGGIPWRFALK